MEKKQVLYLITFIGGFVIGAVGAHLILKKIEERHHKKEEEEREIEKFDDDFFDDYEDYEDESINENEEIKVEETKNEESDSDEVYIELTKKYTSENSETVSIDSSEFGSIENYYSASLDVFNDGIVSENGVIIKNPEEILGHNYLERVKEKDENGEALYLRNVTKEMDFEVVYNNSKYSDIYPKKPRDPIVKNE